MHNARIGSRLPGPAGGAPGGAGPPGAGVRSGRAGGPGAGATGSRAAPRREPPPARGLASDGSGPSTPPNRSPCAGVAVGSPFGRGGSGCRSAAGGGACS
ncbi:hypothetical protein GCM10009663_18580 [Kitasatospora arboriphila]|uniref:Uncharacterized protein n=1 Tax=Kitasatospora arboriphila TaxID=258052 RepID=A0ABN1TDV4_9ACTN